MTEMKVRLTFTEDVLGTANSDPEIHSEFIAKKAPDAPSREEEIEALGADEVFEKSMTVFPKLEDSTPFIWDYQIRGFFKDACGMLRKVSSMKSSKMRAYKKEIDGLIFVKERKIPFHDYGEITICQRPLRASTAQGERIALASSEQVQAGAWIEFTVMAFEEKDLDYVREWFDYGKFRGMCQWRNSGKGRYVWDELDKNGKIIGGNNQYEGKELS